MVKLKVLKSRIPMFFLAVSLTGVSISGHAQGHTFVYINGYELSAEELYLAEQQLGAAIAPGNYLYDGGSGCWMELNSGQSGCPGSAGAGGSYISRYGSGEWNANGDWNHWSNAAGGAVGGSGDGCVYTTFGWSNC